MSSILGKYGDIYDGGKHIKNPSEETEKVWTTHMQNNFMLLFIFQTNIQL
jgi:hypothetical protein